MALHVVPEHLPITTAELSLAETTLGGVLSAAAGVAVPVPAAMDPVSMLASAAFAQYAAPFFETTVAGMRELHAGAQELVPVAVSYRTTDTAGGAAVAPHGAGFVR
ncbi:MULTISPECIES: PE domain-containing protein [unclassified Nocardia]|uniref:PE domain-containing protein n=1 Tax=unclassified Nocardia TaxID=2637762 RepID=UPI0024A86D22|nr:MULTISPECIES: PE domain-containing protein [unclassified Nocardia]